VPLIENYNEDLASRTSPTAVENSARDFPMFWTPFVNCPWSESSNQLGLSYYSGIYSPKRMRSTAFAGLVGNAAIPNLIFFDLFTMTEDALVHGVSDVALQMQDLKPSLLGPLTRAQPSISVKNQALRAKAWSEDVVGSNTVCIHAIVLNIENGFQTVAAQVSNVPRLPANITAVLPFEDNGDRQVQVINGEIRDMIPPNSVNVYRIGCSVPPPDATNLSPNPSFEMPSLLGGISGWSGGRAGWWASDGHDLRARMFLDTTRPQHGRYALRITVPSMAPLTTMWSQACVDPYYPKVHSKPECNADSDGMQLPKKTKFVIKLWARTDHAKVMKLEVLSGGWVVDPAEASAFHTVGKYARKETFAEANITSTWQLITATVAPSAQDRNLQLQIHGGPGMIYIDNTFIGANLTEVDNVLI